MRPVLAVLLAALCFSTTGTAQALADTGASPVAVGAARVLIGGGVLGIVALLVPGQAAPALRSSWPLVLLGAVGVLAYQPAFFLGTRVNGVAAGTLVALGSAPLFTGVLDALLRRRAPSRRWAVATVVALAGVALLSGVLDGGTDAVRPAGIAASLLAGAAYAAYALATKLLLDRGHGPVRAIGAIFGTAAVGSLPILLVAGAARLAAPSGLALALWLGLVATAAAYLVFGWGLQRLAVTTASTLTLAEPLAATLLGLGVLHERLAPTALAGAAVVAVGLALLSAPSRRGRAVAPAA